MKQNSFLSRHFSLHDIAKNALNRCFGIEMGVCSTGHLESPRISLNLSGGTFLRGFTLGTVSYIGQLPRKYYRKSITNPLGRFSALNISVTAYASVESDPIWPIFLNTPAFAR